MLRIAEPHEVVDVFKLLFLPHHAENAIFSLNREKALAWCTRLVEAGRLVLCVREGEIAGGIAFRECDIPYSDDGLLADEFYYVRPEFRGDSVGRELERSMETVCKAAQKAGLITVFNPNRAKKRGRIGQIFGWIPVGYSIRIS